MVTISKKGRKAMGRIFSEPLQLKEESKEKDVSVITLQTYRSVWQTQTRYLSPSISSIKHVSVSSEEH